MVTPSVIFAFSVCRGRCAIVFLRLLAACAVMTALVCGCEKDDDDSSDDSLGISTNPATQLLGVWIGPAGTAQLETTVELTSYAMRVPETGEDVSPKCGTLTWYNGDRRRIVGAVYLPPVFMFRLEAMENGSDLVFDELHLRYDGASLSGVGTTADPDGSNVRQYGVYLTRRP